LKQIYNWQKATVFDIEGDGLLEDISIFHILSYKMQSGKSGSLLGNELDRWVKFFNYHIDNEIPVVAHYGIWFDVPAVEKLLKIDLSKLMVIDTVALSWYLNTKRKQHGLDSFFEDYGIKKVEVAEDQWAFKPSNAEEQKEHDALMKLRCDDDVRINVALWEDFKGRLLDMYSLVKYQVDAGNVDGTRMSEDEVCYIDRYKRKSSVVEYVDRILTFLMFKCDCARLQEKTRWEVNTNELYKLHDELEEIIVEAKRELESVMPEVPKYVKKTYPKKPTKKANSKKDCDKVVPSASGLAWNGHVDNIGKFDDLGNEISVLIGDSELKVINKYEPPNANSSDQIKKFLFSHGWKPETFKYEKDEKAFKLWAATGYKKSMKPKERAIPQINKEVDDVKELCPSVVKLIDKVPEIASYAKYTTVKNRLDNVKGHIRDLYKGKYLKAGVGGFTSTLRVQHRELVNLPAVNKMYGDRIRGYLIAGEGRVCLGSDLSSLEDRVKHHFMLPHDPNYVSTMMESDFDPHILMALTAGLITQEEFDDFKLGIKSENTKTGRRIGKTVNYASVYQAGVETIARGAGVDKKTGKVLHTSYWDLNWSVKAIAEEQCVITCDKGLNWLVNPINGFCYSLRKEKDRFSALAQGTGSFIFDMWLDNILDEQQRVAGKKSLTGSFHDEYICVFRNNLKNRELMEKITRDSIQKVNEDYMLRRPMDCDVQFGDNYSEIH